MQMINLYLLGEKGFVALKNLNNSKTELISNVIIGTDSKVKYDYSNEIIELCKKAKISYQIQNKTSLNTAKYSIAIGWRWLINDDSKLIVFHDSLLPKYRGFNPLVTALINGDEKIGVTALKGSKNYDEGEIIAQESIKINYPINIRTAIGKIAESYAILLQVILDKIISNELLSKQQDRTLVSYSLWRDEEDYKIKWDLDSHTIKRFIEAVGYPYKGAFTMLNEEKIIIKDAAVVDDVIISNRTPGKVIFKDGKFYTIVCGNGLLKVSEFYDENGDLINLNNFRLRFK